MYTNAVFRMVEKLPNCRGIIGPWSHNWPDESTPGPQVCIFLNVLHQEKLDKRNAFNVHIVFLKFLAPKINFTYSKILKLLFGTYSKSM